MNRLLKIYKYLAFLNIPFMVGALYFAYLPLINRDELKNVRDHFSMALILIGFAMTFTSLRDVKKIDKMGRFIIERPRFLKIMVFVSSSIALITLFMGIYMLIRQTENSIQMGIGLTSFGLGYLAMVKSIIDQAKDLTQLYD